METFIRFLKDWTLPVAIAVGMVVYLTFRYVPQLDTAGDTLSQTYGSLSIPSTASLLGTEMSAYFAAAMTSVARMSFTASTAVGCSSLERKLASRGRSMSELAAKDE